MPEAPAPAALELLLALCRPSLSLLGLLAAELDEDEAGDDDEGDGLALHARLADLRPFVDDLVAADRGAAPPPPPATTGDDDSAPSSSEEEEVDYGT